MDTARDIRLVELFARPEPVRIDLARTAVIGGATNICVGTTLMDAFFLDYWPILVEDACFS
jgi:isochorismate hydrolase